MSEADLYEIQAEKFLTELEEEYYLNGAGLKNTLDTAPIYKRYEHLFTLERAKELLGDRQSREGNYLAQFATYHYLEQSVCELTAEIATAETQATILFEGEAIPYRQCIARIPHDPDSRRRRELIYRVHEITARHNPLREARFKTLQQKVKQFGVRNCSEFCEILLKLNLYALRDQMQRLLTETAGFWQNSFAESFEAAGVSQLNAHLVDLRHVLTAPHFEPLFSRERLMPALETTLSGLGISLNENANLHLDIAARELKSERPFCCPVSIPNDIRLVTMLTGGREDYNHLLHEAGHAVHYASTKANAPFAFRCLGDTSVSEAYAFLFNLLLRSPAWLHDVLGIEINSQYLEFACFYHLYQVRRLSSRLDYELELYAADGPTPQLADYYCQRVGDALSVEMPREQYLSDLDDFFYTACYLRAWMLEAQLRRSLVEQFGPRWFATKNAGDYLKELWALGQEYTADELAQRLGYSGLQIEPLIEDLLTPV